jgi:CBS domain-containing protein
VAPPWAATAWSKSSIIQNHAAVTLGADNLESGSQRCVALGWGPAAAAGAQKKGLGMATARHLLDRKGRAIFSIGPDEPVLEAIRLMAEHHVGALLVLKGEQLVGIVSERDYARKVILKGRSSADTPVAQIMSSPVITVTLNSSVQDCMQLMTTRHLRHLPVLEAGKVVGMVSIGDLVKAVMEEQKQTIEQLESYIHQ